MNFRITFYHDGFREKPSKSNAHISVLSHDLRVVRPNP